MSPHGYDPNQPRVPAGNSDGGQWTSDASLAGTAARQAAGLSQLKTVDRFPYQASKAVLWNGKMYQVGARHSEYRTNSHHAQILAEMALENPEKMDDRLLVMAESVRENDVVDFSMFEIEVQERLGALTLEKDFLDNLTVITAPPKVKPTPEFAMKVFKTIERAIERGDIETKFLPGGKMSLVIAGSPNALNIPFADFWKIDKFSVSNGQVFYYYRQD